MLARIDELKRAGGRVVDTVPVSADTLRAAGIAPVVSGTSCPLRWKARRLDNDGRLFFLCNFAKTGPFEAVLRVTGKVPELFDPVTGEIRKLVRYRQEEGGTRIWLDVRHPSDAFFLVFRDPPGGPSVVKASAPPADLALTCDEQNRLTAESGKAGTYTLNLSDLTTRTVVIDQDSQAFVISAPWTSTPRDEKAYSVLHEVSFEPPADFGKGRRILLDLGTMGAMAGVTLNQRAYDTLWTPPFMIDVTDALKVGVNTLQVLVTSTSPASPPPASARLRTTTRVVVPGR